MLLLPTGEKTGGVLEKHHRNVVEIAEANKAGIFIGRVDVYLSRCDRRVVGHKAHNMPCHTAKCRDGIARSLCLNLKEIAVVTELLNKNGDVHRGVKSGG